MRFSKNLIISSLFSAAMLIGFSGLAEAAYSGKHQGKHHAKKTCSTCHHPAKKLAKYACCTTVKERFASCDQSYHAGCKAASSYVTGHITGHSRSWNEGFTDCRFNMYRSNKTEMKIEKREASCGSSHSHLPR